MPPTIEAVVGRASLKATTAFSQAYRDCAFSAPDDEFLTSGELYPTSKLATL